MKTMHGHYKTEKLAAFPLLEYENRTLNSFWVKSNKILMTNLFSLHGKEYVGQISCKNKEEEPRKKCYLTTFIFV